MSMQENSGSPPQADKQAKPKHRHARLVRELAVIIVIKLVIILVAGFTVFGSKARLHVTPDVMKDKVFAPTQSGDT